MALTYGDGGSSSTLETLAEGYANTDTVVSVYSTTHKGVRKAEAEIREFRKSNTNGRIVLMGYSRGGGAAVEIINSLGDDNISVSSLVLFDGWRASSGPHVLDHDNVATVLSFNQVNGTTSIFGSSPFTGNSVIFGSGNTTGLTNNVLTGVNTINGNLYTHNGFINEVLKSSTIDYRGAINSAVRN